MATPNAPAASAQPNERPELDNGPRAQARCEGSALSLVFNHEWFPKPLAYDTLFRLDDLA